MRLVVAGGRSRRAEALADAIRGRVTRGSGGTVVEVERSGSLPLSRLALSRLPDPVDPERPLVCLDTETTGLGTAAGTVPFMVGLGTWDGSRFTVRQFILPDHADEPALLERVAAAIPEDAWLVTYNGRSFDWPLLQSRYRLHGDWAPAHAGHLDLLPLARQLWRHRLADARLATVEAGVAGVRRTGDLPGAAIPERYFRFLRTGQAWLLADVVRHNRQDIASLARLLHVLSKGLGSGSGCSGGPASSSLTSFASGISFSSGMQPGDLCGLGRAYVRRRRFAEALDCFDAAAARGASAVPALDPWAVPLHERLAMDRARVLARLGRPADAAAAWAVLAEAGGRLGGLAWIQVAKHREHHDRDPVSALDAASRAGREATRRAALGMPLPWVERDLARRMPRLRQLVRALSSARRPAA
ncbi:MAG: ribonuclease H-like domain-containing protein [Chloroflexota bacterium]|nr:ribonuclease H-like domain-containing protein [Chloroflexota bacterium]